jgi:hypothetical protein
MWAARRAARNAGQPSGRTSTHIGASQPAAAQTTLVR